MADPHIIKSNFRVEGMDCPTCSAKIETALGRLSGIKSINVSYTSGALKVFHDEALGADAIKNQVIALGFKIKEQQIEAHLHDHGNEAGPWWKTHKAIMTMVCAASLAIAYAVSLLYPAVENEAYAGALVVGLFPIARRAFEGAKAGSLFSIETLMTIAAGRVLDIANMVSLSKKVMGNIQQNITIALGLKAVFLVTTILGITGLWPAILADTGATVLVTANAMRLLRWQGN